MLGRGSVSFGFVCVVCLCVMWLLVNLRVTYNDTLPLLLLIFAGLTVPTSHLSLFELLKVPPVHGTQASSVSPCVGLDEPAG